MNNFENRTGNDLNRKTLIVEEIEKDEAGDIVSITGNLIRNDNNSTGGTPLNASNFNAIIQAKIAEYKDNVIVPLINTFFTNRITQYKNDIIIPIINNIFEDEINEYKNNIILPLINSIVENRIIVATNDIVKNKIDPHFDYTYQSREKTIHLNVLNVEHDSFAFTTDEIFNIEIVNEYSEYINVTSSKTNNYVYITISAYPEEIVADSCQFDFKVNLISQSTGKIIHRVFYTITCINSSNTPND